MKTALICGVSGQDGAYLAKLLLEKGYHVVGTSRDCQGANLCNLDRLSITDHVQLESMPEVALAERVLVWSGLSDPI
jgi:GDPmannose 4,6-dehydratase